MTEIDLLTIINDKLTYILEGGLLAFLVMYVNTFITSRGRNL